MRYPGRTQPCPEIAAFTLGPFATNCYVVEPPDSPKEGEARTCWIVDASFEPGRLLKHVADRGLKPAALILTHAHVDHIAGVRDVLAAYPGLEVMIHEAEAEWLGDPVLNLSAAMGVGVTAPAAARLLRGDETLTLGSTAWSVVHTPGHSPGGIALIHDESRTAIVGDALFAGSVGRTDFPGSDPDVLARSIRERLYTLPDDTRVVS
ncbi:MAG: MBL fold metallo-hydrolase, partial [Phycisphaerales bacterium]|nr:MBL fold metallo-hydrolase [Phycisphaerales bacterium]